jgi:hypothetical protein
VQHEAHDELVGQLAEQLLQELPQPRPQVERQFRLQGSKQLSERRPRRNDSSKQGRGQQRPTEGGGIAVQQLGAAQVGAAHVGAQEVQDGAGVAHELQPPRANRLWPTGLMTE